MSNALKFYINGAWVDPVTPKTLDVINPATEEAFAKISIGSVVSRELIGHVSAYPLTIGLLALTTFCMTFGSSYYLQRVHG